jgi:hypothetical protein
MFENAGYDLIKQQGINKINSWKFRLFNFITCGILKDTQYSQFVNIVKINKNMR